jgi:integrase
MGRPKPARNDELMVNWAKTLKPATAKNYGECFGRLLDIMKLDSRTLYENAEADPVKTWRAVKQAAQGLTSHTVRRTAQYGARSFLLSQNEDLMLPKSNLKQPDLVKDPVYLTWDEANKICDAASLPYSLVFKIMLYCGWGIGELLKFNKNETWDAVKAKLSSGNGEYFRFGFKGRKSNRRSFYSLIPAKLLADAIALEAKGKIKLPLSYQKKDGTSVPLDEKNVIINRRYLESAFETALKRAPIILTQGHPSPHELRDTFFTRSVQVGCADSAANFTMGHVVDKLGYNKCDRDEKWLWGELNKIHGPIAVTEDELVKRDAEIAELKQRLAKTEREKPNMDKWFEENIETIIKKFNAYGVDMKIRNKK